MTLEDSRFLLEAVEIFASLISRRRLKFEDGCGMESKKSSFMARKKIEIYI